MSKNDEIVALARANGAPEFLLTFMRNYPYYIPTVPGFMTTAYQQYVPHEIWKDKAND